MPKRKKQNNPDHRLVAISHHRNGSGGAGFYIALFESNVDWTDWPVVPTGRNKNLFQVIFFPEYEDEDSDEITGWENMAVTNVALSNERNIAMMNNSWRGADYWGEAMADAIENFDKSQSRWIKQADEQKRKQKMRQHDRKTKIIPVRLKGKNIVLTGTIKGMTRNSIKKAMEKLGIIVQANVTKETDLVIKATKPGKAKITKAKKYGITIIPFSMVKHRF